MRFLLEFLAFSVLVLSHSCTSIEESFCAGTGYSDGANERLGLLSMGWSFIQAHPLNTIWGANHAADSSKKLINVDIFAVSSESQTMNGWLYLTITTTNPSSHVIIGLAVWALTDTRESIGEFVHPDVAFCSNKQWNNGANYIPCSAAPINEPSNPNMFVYEDSKKEQLSKSQSINLLWRTSVTYCNMPRKFRFMIALNTQQLATSSLTPFPVKEPSSSNKGPLVYATVWFEPKFYGAASSPPINHASLTCTTAIDSAASPWLRQAPVKTSNGFVQTLGNEWMSPRWPSSGGEDENVAKKRATCKAAANGVVDFGGRCTEKVGDNSRVYASHNMLHKCEVNTANFDDMSVFKGSYDEALKAREDQLKSNCECPPVPTADEVKNIDKKSGRSSYWSNFKKTDNTFKRAYHRSDTDTTRGPFVTRENRGGSGQAGRSDENSIEAPANPYLDDTQLACKQNISERERHALGLCTQSVPGRQAYGVRQWHAVSALFCIVVLNPVTSFMARYLKGTFSMTGKTPLPIRTWYIVHIAIILPMVCMYTTGMAAITRQRPVLGYSFTGSATFHRRGGLILFGVAILELFSGFVRPKNLFMRRCAIGLHWFGGTVLNYYGLILCILTYRIPASPTSFHSHVSDKEKFESVWHHMAPVILILWGCVDVVFHVYLMIHILKFDKRLGISRSHFPVILPILIDRRDGHGKDEFQKEASFQRGAFTAYAIAACVTFLLTCIAIYNFNEDENHGYGPMYCTHDKFGKFIDPKDPNAHLPKSGKYC